ncbi:uncharacterized protein LOC144659841 [Oculina patagonica]
MISLANAFFGIFTVLAFLVLVGGSRNYHPSTKGPVLIYKQHSPEIVQGCYHQHKSLALCFDIQASFIELSSGDNSTLVRFSDLPHEMFVFQILDDAFVGYRSSKVPMHLQDLPRKHNDLHNQDWKRMFDTEHNPDMANRDAFAAKFNSALTRLRNTREITLLHALSTALKENASNHVITMRFHVLCMTLFPENGPRETAVPKGRWSKKVFGYTTDKKGSGSMEFQEVGVIPTRKKRNIFRSKRSDNCRDLRFNPNDNDCLGMCGPGCSCWSFVCGNCCYNQLCFEHDKCCRHEMFSLSCLLPVIYYLSCENGFGGYPSCLI